MILPVSKATEVNPILPAEAADTGFQKKHNANRFIAGTERSFQAEMNRHNKRGQKQLAEEQREDPDENEPEIFAIFTDRDFRQLLIAFGIFSTQDLHELIRSVRFMYRTRPDYELVTQPKGVRDNSIVDDSQIRPYSSHYTRNLLFHSSRPGNGITLQM